MNVWEFEQAVYELEEVRIVVRAPWKKDLGDYGYERAASGNVSVTDWFNTRIGPALDNEQVVIIDGNGAIPHGRTKMSTLRASYER